MVNLDDFNNKKEQELSVRIDLRYTDNDVAAKQFNSKMSKKGESNNPSLGKYTVNFGDVIEKKVEPKQKPALLQNPPEDNEREKVQTQQPQPQPKKTEKKPEPQKSQTKQSVDREDSLKEIEKNVKGKTGQIKPPIKID
jgi:hypothetical protein